MRDTPITWGNHALEQCLCIHPVCPRGCHSEAFCYVGVNTLIKSFPGHPARRYAMAARGKKLVTKSIPAFIARTQFGQILERVSGNRERFVVTKKGEAKAIILGVEDFLQAVVQIPPELAAIQAEAKKRGVDTLTLEEIEAEIQ